MLLNNADFEPKSSHVLSIEEYLIMLSAVSNEKRFRALEYLISEGETTASELAETLDIAHNTLNNHIEELMEAGLVKNWKRNQRETAQRYSYYISTSRANIVMRTLTDLSEELQTGKTQLLVEYQMVSDDRSLATLKELAELRERVERLERQQ